jgi:hypothetical protein
MEQINFNVGQRWHFHNTYYDFIAEVIKVINNDEADFVMIQKIRQDEKCLTLGTVRSWRHCLELTYLPGQDKPPSVEVEGKG